MRAMWRFLVELLVLALYVRLVVFYFRMGTRLFHFFLSILELLMMY